MSNLTWQIGDVTITRIKESEARVPLNGLFSEATPAALEKHKSWLMPHYLDEENHATLSFHALVVESQGRRIVVDTCLGEHGNPYGLDIPTDGFLKHLTAAGFAPETIDTVLCTHLHFDHVGWNTMKKDGQFVPTFPNARYLFSKEEYDYWSKNIKDDLVFSFSNSIQPIIDNNLVDLVAMDHRLTDEVWLQPTPGHSPGHVSVIIESKGDKGMISGDVTHHPVQWGEPSWCMPIDYDKAMSTATRQQLIQEHADTSRLIIGTHYAEPCCGYLVKVNDGVQFVKRND